MDSRNRTDLTYYTEMGYHTLNDGTSIEIFPGPDGKWYWWPCFPSCIPDGERQGPFEDSQEALKDATCHL